MSCNRFEEFCQCQDLINGMFVIEMINWHKSDHFLNTLLKNVKTIYVPSFQLTTDELLITSRGRCHFWMYFLSKPGCYVIKFFLHCVMLPRDRPKLGSIVDFLTTVHFSSMPSTSAISLIGVFSLEFTFSHCVRKLPNWKFDPSRKNFMDDS